MAARHFHPIDSNDLIRIFQCGACHRQSERAPPLPEPAASAPAAVTERSPEEVRAMMRSVTAAPKHPVYRGECTEILQSGGRTVYVLKPQ